MKINKNGFMFANMLPLTKNVMILEILSFDLCIILTLKVPRKMKCSLLKLSAANNWLALLTN